MREKNIAPKKTFVNEMSKCTCSIQYRSMYRNKFTLNDTCALGPSNCFKLMGVDKHTPITKYGFCTQHFVLDIC